MVIVEQSVNVALVGRGPGAVHGAGPDPLRGPGRRAPRARRPPPGRVPLGRGRVMRTVLAFTVSNEIVSRGIVNGLVYALVALGLVLVFRATGVINFAHGQIGAFGGYVMAIMFVQLRRAVRAVVPARGPRRRGDGRAHGAARRAPPVPPAAPAAVRRHARRRPADPRAAAAVARRSTRSRSTRRSCRPAWEIPGIDVTLRGDQLVVLIAVPVLVLILGYLLQRTRFGLAVRSAADNPNAASLVGHQRARGLDPGLGDRRRALGRERAAHRPDPEPRRRERAGRRSGRTCCCSPSPPRCSAA